MDVEKAIPIAQTLIGLSANREPPYVTPGVSEGWIDLDGMYPIKDVADMLDISVEELRAALKDLVDVYGILEHHGGNLYRVIEKFRPTDTVRKLGDVAKEQGWSLRSERF